MPTLGLNVDGGSLRWTVVDGTLATPVHVARDAIDYGRDESLRNRMSWFLDRFHALVDEHAPDRVGYRMHMGRGMTQEQIGTYHYPWGILLLCCAVHRIEPVEMTGSSLTAKRFGLPKGVKPMIEVDALLGKHPPRWDDAQRYSACAGWALLA